MWNRRALGTWLLLASVAVAKLGVHGADIIVKEISGKVFLQCQTSKEEQKKHIVWKKGEYPLGNMTQLDLGAIYDDPRGVYTCSLGGNDKPSTLQVHYRMCQNCIEVDAPTISGIVVADVVATVFLAIAVYCISGQDKGRMSRASDRQNLIANDQLYQPLGERNDGQYSQLATAKARK
ncbi:T-cell surface glycoprotein CD3 delta chain-like [Centrocercus urophasianus]|uniref:T-cell surface glycoprotein CD3 delta chain-like n=1 Tax=Centrocercus urophasianus TaxID=9002 RepID=UPI001C651D6C|nr:T-cell surface glycoprotein CD3 delta chain-like [Centrocercus urophasianus]